MLEALRQLKHELHATLAAGVKDRFGLGALHAPRFDVDLADPALCQLPRGLSRFGCGVADD